MGSRTVGRIPMPVSNDKTEDTEGNKRRTTTQYDLVEQVIDSSVDRFKSRQPGKRGPVAEELFGCQNRYTNKCTQRGKPVTRDLPVLENYYKRIVSSTATHPQIMYNLQIIYELNNYVTNYSQFLVRSLLSTRYYSYVVTLRLHPNRSHHNRQKPENTRCQCLTSR